MPMRAVQQIMLGTVTAKEDQAMETLAVIKKAGRELRQGGIELLYHNHNCEFRKVSKKKTAYSMELGYGDMNLKALVEQAKAAGVDTVILESHKNWADKLPVKSIQLSSEFMKKYV